MPQRQRIIYLSTGYFAGNPKNKKMDRIREKIPNISKTAFKTAKYKYEQCCLTNNLSSMKILYAGHSSISKALTLYHCDKHRNIAIGIAGADNSSTGGLHGESGLNDARKKLAHNKRVPQEEETRLCLDTEDGDFQYNTIVKDHLELVQIKENVTVCKWTLFTIIDVLIFIVGIGAIITGCFQSGNFNFSGDGAPFQIAGISIIGFAFLLGIGACIAYKCTSAQSDETNQKNIDNTFPGLHHI